MQEADPSKVIIKIFEKQIDELDGSCRIVFYTNRNSLLFLLRSGRFLIIEYHSHRIFSPLQNFSLFDVICGDYYYYHSDVILKRYCLHHAAKPAFQKVRR